MILSVPPGYRVLIVLVHKQPPLLDPRRSAAYQHEVSAQLAAVEIEMQVARLGGLEGIGTVADRPGSPVPHDDVTASGVAGEDHARFSGHGVRV